MNDSVLGRLAALTVAGGMLIAGCGDGDEGADTTLSSTAAPAESTTTRPAPTTTTTFAPTTTTTLSAEEIAAIQQQEDVLAIKQLWRRYSDAWFGGEGAGFAYIEAHNYPGEGCTADDFAEAWQVAEGFQEEIVVDEDSIERDDGWPIPGGNAAGIVPEGRIYIMSVEITDTAPGFDPSVQSAEVHVTVQEDGAVYFFFACS